MISPMVLNTPTVLKISPHIYHDIPHGTEHPPWYSRYPPTVLMISPTVLNTPHGTEHPPRYCTHIIQGEGISTTEKEEFVQPLKQKCLRSLSANAVLREILEYYSGKRSGPGERIHVQKLDESRRYAKRNYYKRLNHLI